MNRGGYTLIELVIALAIGAMVLSITVPRYDSYEQHLALQDQVQSIIGCMQSAAQSVTVPSASGTPINQVQVTISNDTNTQTAQCSSVVDGDSSVSPVTSSATLCQVNGVPDGISSKLTYGLSLDTKAAPINPQSAAPPTSGNPIQYPISLSFADSYADCNAGNGVSAVIPALGLPISYGS